MKQTTHRHTRPFRRQRANAGFTLVELMIVLGIIAIISAVALPSYQESTRRTNRTDGMTTMLETAQTLERCFTTYGKYDNASCSVLNGASIASPKGHYNIAVVSTPTTFSLTATPQGSQVSDTKCANLTLENKGLKSATGTTPTKCW